MLLKPELHIKRPNNSFIIWSKKERIIIAKKYPELSITDISIYLGILWNSLPKEEKYIYKLESEKIKAEHLKLNPGYKYNPKHKNSKQTKKHKPISQKRKYKYKKNMGYSVSETKADNSNDYQYKECIQSFYNSDNIQNIIDPINEPEEFDYYDIFQNFITTKIY